MTNKKFKIEPINKNNLNIPKEIYEKKQITEWWNECDRFIYKEVAKEWKKWNKKKNKKNTKSVHTNKNHRIH